MWKNAPYAHDAVIRGSSTRTSGRSLARFVSLVAPEKPQQSKKVTTAVFRGTVTSQPTWLPRLTNSVMNLCREKEFAVTAIAC